MDNIITKPKILWVDDDRLFTEMVKNVLHLGGFDFKVVSTGGFALQELENENYDLVITDISMPGMDGINLVRNIRKIRPDQKIIIVTAFPSQHTQLQASQLGTLSYMVKPISPHRVIETIKEILSEDREGLVGSVQFSCEELVQIYALGGRTLLIEIFSHGDVGRVYLDKGAPIHASTAYLQGEEAFYEIITWNIGVFIIKEFNGIISRTIQRCTDALLLEGARRKDECRYCSNLCAYEKLDKSII